MPIYHQTEGARTGGTGTRVVSGFPNVNTIRTTVAIAGLAVGDVVEVFNNTSGNNGFYTVQAFSGLDISVQPALISGIPGGGGSASRRVRTNVRHGAVAVSSYFIDSYGATVVSAAAGAFLTSGVQVNDRAVIQSAASGQNGAWYVDRVLEGALVVRALDGTPALVSGVGSGTVEVRAGVHNFELLSGNTPASWNFLASGAVASGNTAGGLFGAGPASRFINIMVAAAFSSGIRNQVGLLGVGTVTLRPGSGTSIAWDSADEVVVNQRASPFSLDAVGITVAAAGSPGQCFLTLGDGHVGNDRFAALNGCAWFGISPPTSLCTLKMRGSYWDLGNGSNAVTAGTSGSAVASIIRPRLDTSTGLFESFVVYGESGAPGIVAFGAADMANALVAQQTLAGAITAFNTRIEGFLFSESAVVLPLALILASGFVFANPRQDYDLADLFTHAGTGTSEKRYAFNPRFVERDTVTDQPAVISGLTVVVHEENETTADTLVVFSGQTGADGRLNAGSGLELRRQSGRLVAGVDTFTDYTHRLVVEGLDYLTANQKIQLREFTDVDFPVSVRRAMFEGEYTR